MTLDRLRRPMVAGFLLSVLVASSLRIGLWAFAIEFPIPNEAGDGISPIKAYSAIDMVFYTEARDTYVSMLRWLFSGATDSSVIIELSERPFLAGPVLPILMMIFEYRNGNALPLSFVYLAMSVGWGFAWLLWMGRQNVAASWLLVFAILPLPYWFMLNVSSDLPFAVVVGLFYWVLHNRSIDGRNRWLLLLGIALVASGTRPNGLSLFLFLAALPLLGGRVGRDTVVGVGALLAVIFVGLWVFYGAYFMSYIETGNDISYFGISQRSYLDGIVQGVPAWINLSVSWLALLGAKLVYLCGLRESYAAAALPMVLLRASAGLFLLPGLLYGLTRSTPQERLFLACYLAPIVFGAAQERYVLAILPILFVNGATFYSRCFSICRSRLGGT